MIYNEKFIWIHFPKIAGTKIEEIFKKYYAHDNTIKQDKVGKVREDGSLPWHDSIAERVKYDPSFKVEGKKIIVCVRRLPSWLKSRFNFEIDRNPNLPHKLETLYEAKFLESNGYLNNADYYIKKYLPNELIKANELVFIRVENFEEDFKNAFKGLIDLSLIPDKVFARKSNTSSDHIGKSWLNDEISHNIYKNSPLWSEIEKLAYKVD